MSNRYAVVNVYVQGSSPLKYGIVTTDTNVLCLEFTENETALDFCAALNDARAKRIPTEKEPIVPEWNA